MSSYSPGLFFPGPFLVHSSHSNLFQFKLRQPGPWNNFKNQIFIRDLSYCPDAVTTAYEKEDGSKDDGFGVSCEVSQNDLEYQDPGIPTAPLEVPKPEKAISAGARQTLRSSACFRLIAIAFLLIMKVAEDVE